MNWENIENLLDAYTQYKHYQQLFDSKGWPKKNSREAMKDLLIKGVKDPGFINAAMNLSEFEEWLVLHQIDGNNYTFVYSLQTKPELEVLEDLYNRKNEIVTRIWEFNPNISSDDDNQVLTNLNEIVLVDIHRNEERGKYIYSFLAPCQVYGKTVSGLQKIHKKLFFAHCVLFKDSNELRVVINPTSHLIDVNGVEKDKGDWTPIANTFYFKMKEFIGEHLLIAPLWLPLALHKLAEDASSHNNADITSQSVNAEDDIREFAEALLLKAGLDPEKDLAMTLHLAQDIQNSFEAQLIEKYGIIKGDNPFELFKQRIDGVSHTINVESRETLRGGAAAQAARKSRQNNDIDLLGVTLNTNERIYKFLVEQGTDAYLIRGSKNVFIEEEVVNSVIRKLNEYRDEIQPSFSSDPNNVGTDPVIAS
ncbi:hypothetical protein [Tumebacillus flagellatus]|uniref:Uncharacterized protein n=1 Tax=Tumebacillus flagellatus TaxID=1157490 RepID=A0A074MDE5_9BACL|nr:hypothetical protein [Tumebacillus flagellatus]KEO83877.1 hypothetical protein EL26_08140 [Tumebacillus flagellatus]